MTSDESFLGIGQYRLVRGESPSGLPYLYALSKGLSPTLNAKIRHALRRSPETVDGLSRCPGRTRIGGSAARCRD